MHILKNSVGDKIYLCTHYSIQMEYNTLSPYKVHLAHSSNSTLSLVVSCWTYRVQTAHVNSFSLS